MTVDTNDYGFSAGMTKRQLGTMLSPKLETIRTKATALGLVARICASPNRGAWLLIELAGLQNDLCVFEDGRWIAGATACNEDPARIVIRAQRVADLVRELGVAA